MCLGSSQTRGGTYKSTDDPRFAQVRNSMKWFKGWRDRVMSQPLSDRVTVAGRAMQFISYQCWCVSVLGCCCQSPIDADCLALFARAGMTSRSPPPRSSDCATTGSQRRRKAAASTPPAARRIQWRRTSTTCGRVKAPTRTQPLESASTQGQATAPLPSFRSALTTALRWMETEEGGGSESSTTTTRSPCL